MTDTTDTAVELDRYLSRLAESTQIENDLDAVLRNETRLGSGAPTKRRVSSQLLTQAAAIVLLVGAVALLIMFARPESPQIPSSSVEQAVPPAPRLLAPAFVPAGYAPTGFDEDARSVYESAGIERIYATRNALLGQGPTLSVVASNARLSEPQIDPSATDTEVQRSAGSIWSPGPGQERLRFGPIGATWFVVTGYGIDRATLLELAETVEPSPDGFGAVVDTSEAAATLEEVIAGARYETNFIARSALDQPISHATWANDTGSFEYFVSVDGAAAVDAGRISAGRSVYNTIRDIQINGEPAIIASGENLGGNHTTIYWTAGRETITLTSLNMIEEDVIAVAESMRPTTIEKWPR